MPRHIATDATGMARSGGLVFTSTSGEIISHVCLNEGEPFSHLWTLFSGQIQRSNRLCCHIHSTELMSTTDVELRAGGRYSGRSGGEEHDEPSGSQLILTVSAAEYEDRPHGRPPSAPHSVFLQGFPNYSSRAFS